MCQKGENFYQGRYGNDDGQSKLPEPSSGGIGRQKGNQIQIEPDSDAVGKKRGINGRFRIYDRRKGEEKEADTDTDDEKGPETAFEYQEIQQKTGDACGGKDDGQQNAQVFSFYHFHLTFRGWIGAGARYGLRLSGIYDRRIAERAFF